MVVFSTVGKKLLYNPNSIATVAGLAWSLISFGCNVKLPKVVEDSVSIIFDGGLGMAMFSLGLFMASQVRIVAIGLKGAPFQIAVMQVLLVFMADEEPKPLDYVSEIVLKKRKNNEDWAIRRKQQLEQRARNQKLIYSKCKIDGSYVVNFNRICMNQSVF